MKIRTIEQLNQKLSDDLSWRKKELSEIKKLVESSNVSPVKQNALIRSGVCLLYANWEGFVKLAANSYLEYVSYQNLRYCDLSSHFLALAMRERLDKVKETKKASLYIPICDFFLSELEERCSFPKNVILTYSNLSADVFKDILNTLGLDFSLYSTQATLIIDERLVDGRNKIAHGEYLIINREAYIELHEEVLAMVDLFRNQIENAAINEDFKQI